MSENVNTAIAANTPQGVDVQENTWFIGYDIVSFPPATVISDVDLFSQSQQKGGQYRSELIQQIAMSKSIRIIAIRATHWVFFTALSSEPTGQLQHYFENFSTLNITKKRKVYDPIPLALMLPYVMCNTGGSNAQVANYQMWYELPDPIIVPQGGDIKFRFQAAPGLTTAASSATNPQMPNMDSTYTSGRGFYVKFDFYGDQVVPVA
jgi:hypothetical protein